MRKRVNERFRFDNRFSYPDSLLFEEYEKIFELFPFFTFVNARPIGKKQRNETIFPSIFIQNFHKEQNQNESFSVLLFDVDGKHTKDSIVNEEHFHLNEKENRDRRGDDGENFFLTSVKSSIYLTR